MSTKVIGYKFNRDIFSDLKAVNLWATEFVKEAGTAVERDGQFYFAVGDFEGEITEGATAGGVTILHAKLKPEETRDVKGVEIFKIGKWTDSTGKTFNWKLEHLQEVCENTRKDGVPVTLGHATTDRDQAVGWVHNLRIEAGSLIADLLRVPIDIFKKLNSGFRKRSCGFWKINGKWELDHLALLGAKQSALVLKDIFSYQYELDSGDSIDLHISDEGSPSNMDEKLVAQFEAQIADKDSKIESMKAEFAQARSDFNEKIDALTKELDETKTELAENKDKVTAFETEAAKHAEEKSASEVADFTALVAKKIKPVVAEEIVAVFANSDADKRAELTTKYSAMDDDKDLEESGKENPENEGDDKDVDDKIKAYCDKNGKSFDDLGASEYARLAIEFGHKYVALAD